MLAAAAAVSTARLLISPSWGQLSICRASHVEPTENGQWLVDLAPVRGPLLAPFSTRSAALAAENAWLETDWLAAGRD